jgi:restriction endonuclease Mrr
MGVSPKQLDSLWRGIDKLAARLPSGDEEPEFTRILRPSDSELTAELLDEDLLEEEGQAPPSYLYDRIFFGISRRVRRYSEERNIFKIKAVLEEMTAHLPHMVMPNASSLHERAESLLEQIEEIEPVLIFSVFGEEEEDRADFRPERALIEVPKLVVEVRRDLAARIAMDPEMLRSISPREFEELMAEVFSALGYVVELTAPSRDGGKDIIAVRADHGIVSKLLVECKRYVPPNMVDVGLVRQLYAVKQFEHASKALLVTTSYFTRGARELEQQYLYELELKDFDAVTEWVKAHSGIVGGGFGSGPHNPKMHRAPGRAPRRR